MTLRSVIRGYAFSSHSEKPGILKLCFFFFWRCLERVAFEVEIKEANGYQ